MHCVRVEVEGPDDPRETLDDSLRWWCIGICGIDVADYGNRSEIFLTLYLNFSKEEK